jgi:shikimate kinase
VNRLTDRVYLVGFMGAGKTTVGRALAALLDYDFLDTDATVETAEGRTIEDIFLDRGEGYFREKEWEALASTSALTRVVVATGGGLFLAPMHRSFIRRHGTSVWLDVSVEEVWERCREEGGRPLFSTFEELTALLDSRRPRYAAADLHIKVTHSEVEGVAREIGERIAEIRAQEDAAEAEETAE